MRPAYGLIAVLACAACASDNSEPSSDSPRGLGDGETGTNTNRGSFADAGSAGAPVFSAGSAAPGGSVPGAVDDSSGGGAATPLVPAGAATASGGVSADPAEESTVPLPPAQQRPPVGSLTAGAWDDNLNYARFTEFRSQVAQTRAQGILPFTAQDFDAAHQRFSAALSAHQKLDVALVVDTTGSMGDEIRYLQQEFNDLSSAIEQAYPDAEQRWALVLYKDDGDEYLTRYFDFRDEPAAFRARLAEQGAGGGGDFPEAPDAAFEVLNQFAWRSGDDVARLAFWVADAPHHDAKAAQLADGISDAQAQGIHVYPVASSGIDDFTELTMRSAAQLTGGRYLFLTNDSGLGGNHKEPSIPCYFVTQLDSAILRMVDIELSGVYREPTAAEVLRTGGNPQDGSCTLASGAELSAF